MTAPSAGGEALAGLILAGGEGSRFGRPKAWAELPGGVSFLAACCRTLRAAGVAPVVATLPPGSPDPALAGLVGVSLPAADLDMFASLRHGLAALWQEAWERVVVLPVDHPLVAPATVLALAQSAAAAAVATIGGRHGHPLLLSREVAGRIVVGEWAGPTLREVLRAAAAVPVAVDDPGVRANCNTPEALAAGLAATAGRGARG